MSQMVPARQRADLAPGQSFGLRDLVYVSFRRRWIVLAIWIPILVFGVLGLYRETGAFVASSKVMLELSDASAPQNRGTVRPDEYDLAMSTFANLGMSVPVAQRAGRTLVDSLGVLQAIDPDYAELAEEEARLEFILDRLDISRVAESNLMDIQVTSPYERVSLMVNRAVQTAFLDYSANTVGRDQAVAYYEEQMALLQDNIDSLLAVRQAIAMEAGLGDPLIDGRNIASLQASLQGDVYDLRSQIAFRESELNQLRAAAAGNTDFLPLNTVSPNLAGQRARLDEALAELARLRADHPEQSPPVQRQVEQVALLRSTLQASVQDYIRVQEMDLAALRTQLEVVEGQLAEVKRAVRELPYVQRRITLIDTQVTAKSQVLREFQRKLGDVTLSAAADERVNRLLKVTEPEIVSVVSPVRRYLYMGLLAIAGLVAGLLVALLVDRMDSRIYNVSRLGEAVDAPVLGAVTLDRK